jgi:hypothetical protein
MLASTSGKAEETIGSDLLYISVLLSSASLLEYTHCNSVILSAIRAVDTMSDYPPFGLDTSSMSNEDEGISLKP